MAENHMQLIAEKMLQLGIPANLKGYHYLRSSIIRCIENPEVATSVTKLLYPDAAKEFKWNMQYRMLLRQDGKEEIAIYKMKYLDILT